MKKNLSRGPSLDLPALCVHRTKRDLLQAGLELQKPFVWLVGRLDGWKDGRGGGESEARGLMNEKGW